MQTLEQKFASEIYRQVFAVKDLPDHKQYGSMAYTLPILVRSAGLAQALAFVASRKKDPYNRLLEHLAKVAMDDKADGESYLKQSREADLEEYMRLTRRTMLALKWYKRFAESVLGITSTDAADEERDMTQFRREALKSVIPAADTNASLWLDKYLQSDKAESGKEDEDPKKKLVYEIARTIKTPEAYKTFYKKWKEMLKANGVEPKESKTLGRLAVNLGVEATLENSIALNRTYGALYIPGSALKGLASHYAMNSLGDEWDKGKPFYNTLFGAQEDAGFVNFFDALYVPDSGLGLIPDVVTVHHQEYYQKGDVPPADWDSPIPIHFLSANGSFLLALSGPKEWVDAAYQILAYALASEGVGAKTSSGYGRMEIEGMEMVTGLNVEKKSTGKATPSAPPKNAVWGIGKISADGKAVHPADAPEQKLPFQREHVLPKDFTPARKSQIEFVEETLSDGTKRIWVKRRYYPVE